MTFAKGARIASSIDGSLGGLCFASDIEKLARIDLDEFPDARGARSRPPATAKAETEEGAGEARLGPLRRLEVLGELTDGLAHDFNNLLTIILANLERLMDRAEDPELQHQANTAHDAAKRGERLIRSLLSFAQSNPADRGQLDLNAVIRDMEPLLVHCLGLRVQLETRLDADACLVEADASQTEMAILNLAVNARDAMPEGGVLRIETASRTLGGEHDGLHGAFIALTVADTGCGMSPEVLARAFEPHFTTKPKGKGTGLGLPTVRGLAKRVHGTVTIESTLGQGTTVTVYLPRGRSAADAAIAARR
jgi:signal transduction histidine kinase